MLLCFGMYAQSQIQTTIISQAPFEADIFVGINNFGEIYFISDNTFKVQGNKLKVGNNGYNNFQLGEITTANIFNPLKINLFYSDFNTAIILDNRLAEIFKIDFNRVQPYKNVSHISTGYDNTLWIFDLDNQLLELYDYKTNTIRAQTLPVQSEVLDLISNYNYCWLLTKDFIFKYNYFGSLIAKIKNNGFSAIRSSNENLILLKDNSLYFLKAQSTEFIPINTAKFLIDAFSVTNETLYIYDSENLHELQLKIN